MNRQHYIPEVAAAESNVIIDVAAVLAALALVLMLASGVLA